MGQSPRSGLPGVQGHGENMPPGLGYAPSPSRTGLVTHCQVPRRPFANRIVARRQENLTPFLPGNQPVGDDDRTDQQRLLRRGLQRRRRVDADVLPAALTRTWTG